MRVINVIIYNSCTSIAVRGGTAPPAAFAQDILTTNHTCSLTIKCLII